MGILADVLRGIEMPPDKQNQVLALDREFEALRALEAAARQRATDVGPARREFEVPMNETATVDDSLAEITEKILISIAYNARHGERILDSLGLTPGFRDRHIGVLLGKQFIAPRPDTGHGVFYRATAEGRAYIARHGSQ